MKTQFQCRFLGEKASFAIGSTIMMKMGDWYMAAYDLGHPGAQQYL